MRNSIGTLMRVWLRVRYLMEFSVLTSGTLVSLYAISEHEELVCC